ncbi:hypothetical protein [Cupriavidus necator]
MNELVIGLNAWIIQDGNYTDFRVGDRARFALEFGGRHLKPSASRGKRYEPKGSAVYSVVGQVTFSAPNAWAIDFGIRRSGTAGIRDGWPMGRG